MDIFLRQVRIIDPSSPFHQQVSDIFIQNGSISDIGQLQHNSGELVDIPGLHISAGWVDIFAHFCDPGFEFRETLETGARAAASGGFTDVMILPNTAPVVYTKGGVEYIVQRSRSFATSIHPIAAITKNAEGKELAEMYDMHNSGAIAFSDGTNTVQSSGLLMKALQYIRAIDKAIIQLPDDKSISAGGLMNEGVVSTQLGLPGKPAIAEELMIARDIELAKYTGSKIHFTGISTARSCEMIRKAKSDGINVSASVSPYHLCFTDDDLENYDTNLKLNPPLRTKKDRDALRTAVLEGTIDCIASHHLPHDIDNKVVEFENAQYGMTGLETSFAITKSCLPQLDAEAIVQLFSSSPRKVFGLPSISILKAKEACLTLFLPEQKWTVGEWESRSKNSFFNGKELTGKPVGIINKDQLFLKQF